MSSRLKTLLNAIAVASAGIASWNAGGGSLTDWQFLVPAISSALSLGTANGVFGIIKAFLSKDGQAAILKLVSRLIPYRETLMPQEVRDAVFNAMRYRFAGNAEAIAHVDALILLDMQMADDKPKTPLKVV